MVFERLPKTDRAGTQINHATTEKVYHAGKLHGLIDYSNQLYQCGGEYGRFVYHRLGIITLPLDVWQYIAERCDFIEMIDHSLNRCYRLSVARFAETAIEYRDKVGSRIGAPTRLWAVSYGRVEASGVIDHPVATPSQQGKLL